MNHLLRRQWLEMAALALLCLGLLSRPQAAAQGFADGARLCVGSLLPALFPFMVVCELLVGMALPKALLRPQARLLGLQSEETAAALLASWLGGYAVCARLTAQLRVAGRISARDAALLMMLGCCSGPGFVVGYIGGLLLGSTSLGALLYAGQLAANLLAAGLCLPMLPKADAYGVREVPRKKEKQEISLPTAISSAASTCLDLCGCVIFFRVAAGVLLSVAPLPDSAAACVSAACEITAGCAAFAALGGKAALYGICLAMSLLGFSVWGQLRLLLQGQVPMRMLAISRLLHAVLFPLLVRLLLWALPQEQTVFSTLAPRVVPMCRLPPDAAVVAAVFLCTLLYKGYKNIYNTI